MLHCNFNDDCIFARAAHSAKVYRFFIQRGFFTVKIAHKIHNAAVVFVLAALIFVLQPVVGEFERYPFVQVRKLAQAFCNDFGIHFNRFKNAFVRQKCYHYRYVGRDHAQAIRQPRPSDLGKRRDRNSGMHVAVRIFIAVEFY